MVYTRVGRFSTHFLAWFSQWESIDILKCENRIENQPQVLTWLRTDSNVYIYMFLKNRTGSLTELKSGSQRPLYHLLVPLVLLLTWDCYSSPVAITFLPLLFFSLYYYYSSFYCYDCSPIITALSLLLLLFPIALILFLLLLLFSHGVALSMWWSHLIIKTDFN